jgi:hypothetical protein
MAHLPRESLWQDRAIIDFRHAYLLKSESKTLAHFSAYRKKKILFLFSGLVPDHGPTLWAWSGQRAYFAIALMVF